MIENWKRKLFVLRMELRVATNKIAINRAYSYPTDISRKALYGAVTALVIILAAGSIMNSDVLVGISTASIFPSIESMPAAPPVIPPAVAPPPPPAPSAAKVIEPEAVTASLEPVKPVSLPISPARYLVTVEKYSNTLFILQEHEADFSVVSKFDVSMGKNNGRKQTLGDMKTPVGIYRIVDILEDAQLEPIYGPRAFVLNYPNAYDKKHGRTGGGIWLHGTGIGERTPDTRGCVELSDKNIMDLDEWLKVDSQVAIFPEDFPIPFNDGRLEKQYVTEYFFYGDEYRAGNQSATITLAEVSDLQ